MYKTLDEVVSEAGAIASGPHNGETIRLAEMVILLAQRVQSLEDQVRLLDEKSRFA